MKLVSWNVNSLRSAEAKFLEFVNKENPDIILLQELRADPNQLSMFLHFIPQYKTLFNPSGRPGYGGTALYYKTGIPLDDLTNITGNLVLDTEGRVVQFKIKNTIFLNFYVPNGNRNEERLKYKLKYYEEMAKYIKSLIKHGFSVIVGADMNVCHTEIDVYNPKQAARSSGFLPIERKLFDQLLGIGLKDSFRLYNNEGGNYTWWSMRDRARIENHGWRFDYFLISKDLIDKTKKAEILKDVFGSDHCPILLEIEV